MRTYVLNEDVRFQHGTMSCPGGIGGRELRIDGLGLTQTDVLLRVDYLDGSASNQRLTPSEPSVVIPARPSALEVIRTYTVLGIGHILGGVDHLLFVLALLLLVRGLSRLIATVTAFTLAHSVTLAAATLGFVHVPSAPVEATIALSILFLASELARQPAASAPPAGVGVDARADLTRRFPWLVAFSFGLLHGFGFAGALSEVGVPQKAVPLALLFFNVGVEIGQLLFIASVLDARLARPPRNVAGAAVVAARGRLRYRFGRRVLGRAADCRDLLSNEQFRRAAPADLSLARELHALRRVRVQRRRRVQRRDDSIRSGAGVRARRRGARERHVARVRRGESPGVLQARGGQDLAREHHGHVGFAVGDAIEALFDALRERELRGHGVGDPERREHLVHLRTSGAGADPGHRFRVEKGLLHAVGRFEVRQRRARRARRCRSASVRARPPSRARPCRPSRARRSLRP